MALSPLRIAEARGRVTRRAPRQPLGRFLVERGAITPEQLVKALHLQLGVAAPLGEILVAEGWATPEEVQNALSEQFALQQVDLATDAPDPDLCLRKTARFWLSRDAIPWRGIGGAVLIAVARPDTFETLRQELTDLYGPVLPVLAPQDQIAAAIADRFRLPLAQAAETRVAAEFSCRDQTGAMRFVPLAALAAGFFALLGLPVATIGLLSLLALTAVTLFTSLKLAAFGVHLFGPRPEPDRDTAPNARVPVAQRPKVSVLVPLFKESEIAGSLIRRLSRLTYPKVLLDVVIVLEERDDVTRRALEQADLPPWMRVIEVPAVGTLTTKPRAMNYALDFCKGDIIGVWDAEDAPAGNQIERVVSRFADAPDDVVCLQGVLDYYNPQTNWIARCFSIEYASWFRVVLPGIARLGLVVPLGGTTLFFRRDKLEQLGGWDAHNVTEDADLGMRLCRAGWRTEMIDTATYEEANYRPWRWVRQRSRWHKGFMATYFVHMRRPLGLLRDLGAWRFLSFQAFFLGTLGQFLLAPFVWSFWLFLVTGRHPVTELAGASVVYGATAFLILAELLNFAIALVAADRSGRRYLMPWALTMMLYFPLATIAAYKALWELITSPFYWDKTQHGLTCAEAETGDQLA